MLCRFCHFEFFVTFFDFIFVDCSHGKPANICNNMRINFMVFDVRQINTSSQGRVIMVIGAVFYDALKWRYKPRRKVFLEIDLVAKSIVYDSVLDSRPYHVVKSFNISKSCNFYEVSVVK